MSAKLQTGQIQAEIDRLTGELAAANQKIAQLEAALAAAPKPASAPELSPDEPEILRRMAGGLTRKQAEECVARQKHYDEHVAPKRRQFVLNGRARPLRQ